MQTLGTTGHSTGIWYWVWMLRLPLATSNYPLRKLVFLTVAFFFPVVEMMAKEIYILHLVSAFAFNLVEIFILSEIIIMTCLANCKIQLQDDG